MNNEYTQKVLSAVERARREVRSEESAFESGRRSVEIMSRYTTIDIHNTSKAVEILVAAKRTTDELYTSYETIIRSLDRECRPYLNYEISGEAIKKVAELIRYINKESSDLSSNVTGTINGYSMGDLRTEHYMASIEAKIIEKFWADQYSKTPESVEERKRREAALAERRKRQAELAKLEEERKKKEAEEKKRKAELKAAEEKRIESANAIAKSHMDNCESECYKKIEDYKKSLQTFISHQQEKYKDEIDSKIKEIEKKIEELREQESRISGFFKRSNKKEIADEIRRMEARIVRFKDPTIISNEIDALNEQATVAVNKYEETIILYLSERFSDYKSKKKSNKKLMFLENADMAKRSIPEPICVEDVFK